MEIKIIANGGEEKQLNELVEHLKKCGLDIIRQAGGNMPNYSGYFASLKGNYSERQISTKDDKQLDSKALHIADVSGRFPSDEEIETEAEKWFRDPRTRNLRRHDWKNGAYWLRDIWFSGNER